MNHHLTIRALGLLGCALLGGCGSSETSAVEQGQKLFETKALSPSTLNDYSCVSCHDVQASNPPSEKPGAPLAGAYLRPSFWGGQEVDLLRAVNACRNYFMAASQPLTAEDRDARALYAYLESLPSNGDAEAEQPFTIVNPITRLTNVTGDAGRGIVLYTQACSTCHGEMHDGRGRLSTRVPILPEDTFNEPTHVNFSANDFRLTFIEKMRHGLFLDYGGVMPPFSAETLSDQDVSDLLQALGVLGSPVADGL
ncbi:MAG TPA: c-type cytochrome [Polyangiaceae bacterium]|nr:c-type cytochrome [Polyangiaceae bacterium]